MANLEVNYKSVGERNPFRNTNDSETMNDNEDTPGNSGVMIHIVPETNKARWNHIEDLDSFFTRMYNYHQKHGFTVIVLDEILQLCEFGFVIWLLTFTIHCINYSILFGYTKPEGKLNSSKISLNDTIIPLKKCVDKFESATYFFISLAILYFFIKLIRMIYHVTQYLDIKKFYNIALHIEDKELDNITWYEIKKKATEVQTEQHMCIDKDQLTDLDIYHRILRFKNYMVALINKNLLPVRYSIPIIGEVVSLSRGLLINIDFILFRSPGSPFQNNWQRDGYVVRNNQNELAERLSKLIMCVAVANLIFAPVIFIWQIIYFLFSYANVLRKEPGHLGMRTWSNYGRLYFRHFNELDHELDARLNRAYEYADRYLSSFSSPVMALLAKNILFVSGGILVLILLLGIYEEFVFQIEHVLTIITILSAVGLICRNLIPDENLIWCPEQLMTAILAHVHYLPSHWKNNAHTSVVRKEFASLFQFKASYLLNEICSPIITPFLLIFILRPKALEIVKFFKSFTVTVRGVGNVCSFAQMDIRKHGNPEWQPQRLDFISNQGDIKIHPVANGKTELSLIRFTLTNPEWQMPNDAKIFIKSVRENALQELIRAKRTSFNCTSNPITQSLTLFGTIAEKYSSIANSVLDAHNIHGTMFLDSSLNHPLCIQTCKRATKEADQVEEVQESGFEHMLQQNLSELEHKQNVYLNSSKIRTSLVEPTRIMRKMRVYKTEGRLEGPSETLLYSIHTSDQKLDINTTDITVADMCLSTLFLHELNNQNKKNKIHTCEAMPASHNKEVVSEAVEKTPLLGNKSS